MAIAIREFPRSPKADEGPTRRTRHKRMPTFQWLGPLAPALVLLLLFFAGPIIWSVYIAFTNKALTGVGAANRGATPVREKPDGGSDGWPTAGVANA